MGASTSDLSLGDIEEMQSITSFSQKDIKKLYKQFKRLDKESTGRICKEELNSIPELAMSPLSERIISILDSNKDDQVSFKQFIQILNAFSPKAPQEEKQKFMFQVYDVKGDGFIDSDELKYVLKLMVGDNLSEEQTKAIVYKTFQETDKDGDGKISYDEFSKSIDQMAMAMMNNYDSGNNNNNNNNEILATQITSLSKQLGRYNDESSSNSISIHQAFETISNQLRNHLDLITFSKIPALHKMSPPISTSIAQIIKGGSKGKGTAIYNRDILKMVIHFNDFPTEACFGRILNLLNTVRACLRSLPNCRDIRIRGSSLTCVYKKINVDLALCPYFATKEEQFKSMDDFLWLGVSRKPYQTSFVINKCSQSSELKETIRILKYWKKVNYLRIRTYVLELLAIYVYEYSSSSSPSSSSNNRNNNNVISTPDAIQRVMELLRDLKSNPTRITWDLDESKVQPSTLEESPLLLDPVHYSKNILKIDNRVMNSIIDAARYTIESNYSFINNSSNKKYFLKNGSNTRSILSGLGMERMIGFLFLGLILFAFFGLNVAIYIMCLILTITKFLDL